MDPFFLTKNLGFLLTAYCYYTYLCVSLMLSSQQTFAISTQLSLSLLLPLFSWQIHDKTIIRLCCLRKCLKLVPLKCIRRFTAFTLFQTMNQTQLQRVSIASLG